MGEGQKEVAGRGFDTLTLLLCPGTRAPLVLAQRCPQGALAPHKAPRQGENARKRERKRGKEIEEKGEAWDGF